MPTGKGKNRAEIQAAIQLIIQYSSPSKTMVQVRDEVNAHGFNLTYQQVKGAVFRHGLKYKKNTRHNLLMTDEQAEYLMSIIPGKSSKEIAEIFNEYTGLNLTTTQIRGWKKNHKTPSGYDTRFRAGEKPWITGRRFPGRTNSGVFKKGHEPTNRVPVGTVVTRSEYKWIKVKEGKIPDGWQPYHRYLWEQAYGPVPEGMVVTFKDGNTMNCCIENLMLISKSENGVINLKLGGTVKDEPELNDAIRTMAKLKMKIWEKEKDEKRSTVQQKQR